MSKTGIIYKLVSTDINIKECYVGSTTNFIRRKHGHKSRCNNDNNKQHYNLYVYQYIRDNGGWDSFSMIQIEEYKFNTRNELNARERYWIETLRATLNKVIPTRLRPEYNQHIQNKMKEYSKEYREKNKTQLNAKKKDYYEQNKTYVTDKSKEYNRQHKIQIKDKHKKYYEQNKTQFKEKNKEYREHNKIQIKDKSKEYREQNKIHIKEKQKEYYDQNQDKINIRYTILTECDNCFKTIRKAVISRHKKTKKCQFAYELYCYIYS